MHAGRLVRVGGLVIDLQPDGFTIDDGTAIGSIVLKGAALELLPLVEPEDALNVIGRVVVTDVGPAVVVDDPAGLIQAGDLVAPGSTVVPSIAGVEAATALPSENPGSRLASLGGSAWPLEPGLAGIGSMVAVSVLSVAATLVRRARSRRRVAARIAARLATFVGPAVTLDTRSAAERGPRTIPHA